MREERSHKTNRHHDNCRWIKDITNLHTEFDLIIKLIGILSNQKCHPEIFNSNMLNKMVKSFPEYNYRRMTKSSG